MRGFWVEDWGVGFFEVVGAVSFRGDTCGGVRGWGLGEGKINGLKFLGCPNSPRINKKLITGTGFWFGFHLVEFGLLGLGVVGVDFGVGF